MSTVSLPAAAPVVEPRAANWAADAAFWLWRALSRSAELRKAEAVPQVATEAAALREYARQYLNSDPGFAADLFAAANRHEQLNEGR